MERVRVLEYGGVALQSDLEAVGRVIAQPAVDAPGVRTVAAVNASLSGTCYQLSLLQRGHLLKASSVAYL